MSHNHTALIVDDEPDIRDLLCITLQRMDILAESAPDIESAQNLLKNKSFDLCLTDMKLPDGNGIELVTHIQAEYPDIPVAVITAFGSMDTAITALKAGAFDFLSKPINLQHLREIIGSALKLSKEQMKSKHTQKEAENDPILGQSNLIKVLKNQIEKVSRSQAPVFIHGESGTGKELVARMIHERSPRNRAPFIAVNCGAVPSELMESEFFGHKKGSFTGANQDKVGLFQAAQGGTLFLDEVADLPKPMQVKLLRSIQERSVRPIGAHQEIDIDCRILSATHKDLEVEVSENRFRQDLFYRINVINIEVPALRERQEDILAIAERTLRKLSEEWSSSPPKLNADAKEALLTYDYPGNVRQLENILEKAMTLCEGSKILPIHLDLPAAKIKTTHPKIEQTPSRDNTQSLEDYLTNMEKQAILEALESTRWNRTAAAKELGMSFRSLRYRLKKLGIDDKE